MPPAAGSREGAPLINGVGSVQKPYESLSFSPGPFEVHMHSPSSASGLLEEVPTRSSAPFKAGVALVVLCSATTMERVFFKMLVDRVVPFRFLVLLLIVALEAVMLGVVVKCKAGSHSEVPDAASFPRKKLLMMAVLDLSKDLMMIMSGAFVPPTMTVLLLQGQIPVSMAMGVAYERFKGRGGSSPRLAYKSSHYKGAACIAVAVALAFLPAFLQGYGSSTGFQHTAVYLMSCLPASASVLYKEKALTAYRQPMDPYALNLYVDIYQVLLLVLLSPAIYQLQSAGFMSLDNDDHAAGDGDAFRNVVPAGSVSDGLLCFFAPGYLDPEPDPLVTGSHDIYPSPRRAYCRLALPLLSVYVGVSLLVNACVDRVLRFGSGPLLYRAVTLATLSAWAVLGLLAHGEPTALGGLSVALLEVPSVALLAVGNELYHRHQEPGWEVLTEWAIPS